MKFKRGDLVRLKATVAFAKQLPEIYLVEDIVLVRYPDKDGGHPSLLIKGSLSNPDFFELVTSILREDEP